MQVGELFDGVECDQTHQREETILRRLVSVHKIVSPMAEGGHLHFFLHIVDVGEASIHF